MRVMRKLKRERLGAIAFFEQRQSARYPRDAQTGQPVQSRQDFFARAPVTPSSSHQRISPVVRRPPRFVCNSLVGLSWHVRNELLEGRIEFGDPGMLIRLRRTDCHGECANVRRLSRRCPPVGQSISETTRCAVAARLRPVPPPNTFMRCPQRDRSNASTDIAEYDVMSLLTALFRTCFETIRSFRPATELAEVRIRLLSKFD